MLQKDMRLLNNGNRLSEIYKWCLYLCSNKIKRTPAQLEALSETLFHSTHHTEDNFLQVGQTLQAIYGDTVQVTQTMQDTALKMTGDSDENMLNKVEALIGNVQEAVSRHRAHVALNLDQVRSVIDQLTELFNCCHTIERISMNLRVVGLNIGVESTRSTLAREMFTVVSEEIIHLSEKVAKLGRRIREDVAFSQNEQIGAFEAISNGLQSLDKLSSDASKIVRASIGEIENCIVSSQRIFEQTGDRFNEMSNQVGEIVAGMQFHDNMRQRVEHISKALSDAIHQNGTKQGIANRYGCNPGTLHSMKSVISLQQMQLSAVISEIGSVYSQSVSSFLCIENEIKSLVQNFSVVDPDSPFCGDENTFNINNASAKLATALSELNHLLMEGGELAQKIDDSVEMVGKIGERFTRHLKEVLSISFETKIKALNAIVKAGHLDYQGRTLEVLAQEMNKLSKQTETFVATVEDNLSDMSRFAKKLKCKDNGSGDKQSFDKSQLTNLSETLSKEIDAISSFRDQLSDHTQRVLDKSEALGQKVQQTLTELSFLPVFADTLSMSLSKLEEIGNILEPFLMKNSNEIASDTMQLSEMYTMKRERSIHEEAVNEFKHSDEVLEEFFQAADGSQQMISQVRDNLVDMAPEKLAEQDEDEFGENVELF